MKRVNSTYANKTSFNLSERTCASSDGGPGLKRGEHIAGRSRFGTVNDYKVAINRHLSRYAVPMNPLSGESNSGSAISALTPQTTVVLPRRTKAEPSAVDIDPRKRRLAFNNLILLPQNSHTCID